MAVRITRKDKSAGELRQEAARCRDGKADFHSVGRLAELVGDKTSPPIRYRSFQQARQRPVSNKLSCCLERQLYRSCPTQASAFSRISDRSGTVR